MRTGNARQVHCGLAKAQPSQRRELCAGPNLAWPSVAWRGRLWRGTADPEAAGKARLRRRAGPRARGRLCDRVCSASGVSGPGSAEYLRRLCSAWWARSCPAVTLSLPTGRAAAASGRGRGVGTRPEPPLLPPSGPLRDTLATGLTALTENRIPYKGLEDPSRPSADRGRSPAEGGRREGRAGAKI